MGRRDRRIRPPPLPRRIGPGAAGWRGMDDREDELRRAMACERMARRILDSIAAEKLARAEAL